MAGVKYQHLFPPIQTRTEIAQGLFEPLFIQVKMQENGITQSFQSFGNGTCIFSRILQSRYMLIFIIAND